jgi:hypothetical protein
MTRNKIKTSTWLRRILHELNLADQPTKHATGCMSWAWPRAEPPNQSGHICLLKKSAMNTFLKNNNIHQNPCIALLNLHDFIWTIWV